MPQPLSSTSKFLNRNTPIGSQGRTSATPTLCLSNTAGTAHEIFGAAAPWSSGNTVGLEHAEIVGRPCAGDGEEEAIFGG